MTEITGFNMLLSILLPTIAAPICYFGGRKFGRVGNGIFATFILVISTGLLLASWNRVSSGEKVIESYGVWVGLFKLNVAFLHDNLSFPISILISGIAMLAAVYSIAYMTHEHDQEMYFAALLLFTAGMVGVVLASNLILFYLFWEMMLVPSYFLIAYWGTGRPRIIGFKYFMFTHAGAASLLAGILLTYAYTATFDLLGLPNLLSSISPGMLRIIMVLMSIGFAVKLAIFPVHTWLPDAHAEAPTPISVLLSGVMIKTGAYAIVRMSITLFPSESVKVSYGLSVLAVITMLWGGFMALAQTDIKRLLAYSSVSQVGYILFGLMSLNSLGVGGGLFHIVNHGVAKGLLFMCAGAIIYSTGIRDINKLGGLASKMPLTAVATLCGALSIAGTPPFGGFASEWMIFAGGFASGNTVLSSLAIAATMVTVAYYLRMIKKVFFGVCPESLSDVKEAPSSMLLPMAILTFLTVIFGIFAFAPLQILYPAGEAVTRLIVRG
ncbi:NADH-quinone oxidoreductase subunit M [Candidatus Bathyarchaeota archaeon]|nr:NADH-quinone oxidoreductase subunit M [Candidatus Bathyarchaeota archaeon]MBS7629220.1 NADH-quinone oxidoreductase subunit M [Candidatus Bathyarchaeota archaeon]